MSKIDVGKIIEFVYAAYGPNKGLAEETLREFGIDPARAAQLPLEQKTDTCPLCLGIGNTGHNGVDVFKCQKCDGVGQV